MRGDVVRVRLDEDATAIRGAFTKRGPTRGAARNGIFGESRSIGAAIFGSGQQNVVLREDETRAVVSLSLFEPSQCVLLHSASSFLHTAILTRRHKRQISAGSP